MATTAEELSLADETAQHFDLEEPDRVFLTDGRWKGYVDQLGSDDVTPRKKRFLCLACNADVQSLSRGKAHLLTHHPPAIAELFVCVVDKSKQRLRKKTRVFLCKEIKCPFYCKNDQDISRHICGAPFAEQPFCQTVNPADDKAATAVKSTIDKVDNGAGDAGPDVVMTQSPAGDDAVMDESEADGKLIDDGYGDLDASPPPLLINETSHDDDDVMVQKKQLTSLNKQVSDPTTESESDGEVAPNAREAVTHQHSNGNDDDDDAADSLPVLERQGSFSPSHMASDVSQQSDLNTKVSGSELAASESDSEVKPEDAATGNGPVKTPQHKAASDDESMPDLSQNDYEDMPVLFGVGVTENS